jgi:hypothetical protein
MLSVIRKHDARDRDACDSAYRRGQDACRRPAGTVIINPFLPGTSFHKAFDLGVAEARAGAWAETQPGEGAEARSVS